MQPDDLAAINGRRSHREAPVSVRVAIIAAVGGLLLGGLNSLSNVLGSPYSPRSLNPGGGVFVLEVLAAVLGTPGAWAITAFIAGYLTGKVWTGPLVGVATLLIADLTYYLIDSTSGYAALSTDEVVYWAALAVPTGLVMGLLGALATQPHWWSILPGLAAPATLLALARSTGSDHIQPLAHASHTRRRSSTRSDHPHDMEREDSPTTLTRPIPADPTPSEWGRGCGAGRGSSHSGSNSLSLAQVNGSVSS